MDERIVSTAVLTLSRQQEEFLARYRTHEAQKAYFESYGLGVTPFFRGGGGSHGVIPPAPEPEPSYDYEVEYLEVASTDWNDNPYIDTLYVVNKNSIIYAGFTPYVGDNGSCNLIGGRFLSKETGRFLIVSTNQQRVGGMGSMNFGPSLYNDYKKHSIIYNLEDRIVLFDDMTYNLKNAVVDFSEIPSVYLFAVSGYDKLFRGSGRIYYFKVEENNKIVLDMIPVVKNGSGFMYDKVSGKFFASQVGGNFSFGPKI